MKRLGPSPFTDDINVLSFEEESETKVELPSTTLLVYGFVDSYITSGYHKLNKSEFCSKH